MAEERETPQVYKERLLKLATLLDTLPDNRFNMLSWIGEDWKGDPGISCGASACALGWATTIPEFRELGMRLIMDTKENGQKVGYVCLEGYEPNEVKLHGAANGFDGPYQAAKKVFDVDYEEFEFLFFPENELTLDGVEYKGPDEDNATPQVVAEHIRDFVGLKYE